MQTTTTLASQFADRVIPIHPGAETRVDGPYVTAGASQSADTASPSTSERREAPSAPVGTGAAKFAEPKVSTTAAMIKDYVTRIETLKSEIKDRQEDIADLFTEAKSHSLSVKALKTVIKVREDRAKRDREEIETEQADVDLYLNALGELPLFGDE